MEQNSPPAWNADCLSTVSLIAMSQDGRKVKRLARQFNLVDADDEPDTAEMFMRLHTACHTNTEFSKAIARNLDKRFHTTVSRVRSLDVDRIKAIEMNWCLPLIWAVTSDERAEVRRYGQHLLHAMLWDALGHASSGKGKESDLHEATEELEAQITGQKAEIASLREELQRKTVENGRLRELLAAMKHRQEEARSDKSGEGRLLREIRKLKHDLESKMDRIEDLERMLAGSPVLSQQPDSEGEPLENQPDLPSTPPVSYKPPATHQERCPADNDCCKKYSLEGLRVVVVGGNNKMLPEYRDVVSQFGAEFLFHDGKVRNGSDKLKNVINWADIIIFITSMNSHGALNVMRSVCRKKAKKFIVLRETGSESIARTLRNYAA